MKKYSMILLISTILSVLIFSAGSQSESEKQSKFSVKFEELTAIQFIDAVQKSDQTIILPFGVLEKHGPHMPLGTDLINVRELALRAAKDEYTIVYPPYYFGQIFEAKHQPGTIAYSHETIWNLLQETCDELSRNGLKKIIIVNGHGGNNNLLGYFGQVQLEKKRDYAVYLFRPDQDPQTAEQMKKMRKTDFDGHAGEVETATMMAHRPDLVDVSTASGQNGENQEGLANLEQAYTGIWWYANFPNHYAGDGSVAQAELGEIALQSKVNRLIKMIRNVKNDQNTLKLQNKFYNEALEPLKTEQ